MLMAEALMSTAINIPNKIVKVAIIFVFKIIPN